MAKTKDPELAAMSKIAALLAELEPFARERVLQWLIARHGGVVTTSATSNMSSPG